MLIWSAPAVHPQFSFAMVSTDRDVLVALFFSTDGARWNSKRNWNTDAELSQWHGVEVDDENRVVTLALIANNLRGIPI